MAKRELGAIERIEGKRHRLNASFGFNIPAPNVSVVRFRLKSREDAETLLRILRQGLKAALEAFAEYVEEQLRDGRDRTRLQRRVREFLRKLQKQDFLNLLIKDVELRNLMLQLEILTA